MGVLRNVRKTTSIKQPTGIPIVVKAPQEFVSKVGIDKVVGPRRGSKPPGEDITIKRS